MFIKQLPYFLQDDMLAILLTERIQKILPPILLLLHIDGRLFQIFSKFDQLIANTLTGGRIAVDLGERIGTCVS